VVVRYPHHPFAGKRISVIRYLTYADRPHFVVEGPDNGRLLLPAWMTETAAGVFATVAVPRLSMDALMALRRLIDGQPSIARSQTIRGACEGDDGAISTRAATRFARACETPKSQRTTRPDSPQRNNKSAYTSCRRMRRGATKRQGVKQ
jgi:hypothetical protein